MENGEIARRISELQQVTQSTNYRFSKTLANAVLSTWKCRMPVFTMSLEERAKLKGFGPTNLAYIERIINGEPVELVAKDVPVAKSKANKSIEVEKRTRATDLPLNVDFTDLEGMLEELSRLRKEYSAKFGCVFYPGLAEGSVTREITLLSRAIETDTPYTTWSGCE